MKIKELYQIALWNNKSKDSTCDGEFVGEKGYDIPTVDIYVRNLVRVVDMAVMYFSNDNLGECLTGIAYGW